MKVWSIPWDLTGRCGSNSLHSCLHAKPLGTRGTTCSAFPLQARASTQYVCRESSPRPCHRCVVSDNGIFHACCFHLLQQPGRRLIELSEVAPDSETPLRPRHAVGSAAQVDVSAEHRESSNRFRIDTSRPCFHRLLSDLSSLTNK